MNEMKKTGMTRSEKKAERELKKAERLCDGVIYEHLEL